MPENSKVTFAEKQMPPYCLVLPYMMAEFTNNQKSFADYCDEIEISEATASKYFKTAIQVRKREMSDHSELKICYAIRQRGDAFHTVQYAERHGKKIVNIAEDISQNEI